MSISLFEKQQIVEEYFGRLEKVKFFVKYSWNGMEHSAGPYHSAIDATFNYEDIKGYEGISDCRIVIEET